MIVTSKTRFEKVFKSIDSWRIPDTEKARLKNYIEKYRNGDVTNEVTERPEKNLEFILEALKPLLQTLNKDIEKLNEKDTNNLFSAVMQNKIMTVRNKVYKIGVSKRFLSVLRKYLEYHNIPNEIIRPLKKKIKYEKKSKDVITHEELENDLCKSTTALWQYYLHQTLFYGGLRASEFLGIQFRDITLPNKDSNYVKIKIRRENTKNNNGERTITLYGENCFNAVKSFIDERKLQGIKPNDLVMNKSYEAIKSWMVRLSESKQRPIHFHLYRHSSATYLFNKIFYNNYKAFCDFFGWSYSSPTPQIYARRGGTNALDVEVSTKTIEEYKQEIETIQAKKDLEIEDLKRRISKFENKEYMNQQVKQQILKILSDEQKKTIIKVKEKR